MFRIAVFALVFSFSIQTQAALVDNGSFVTDNVAGLNWLKFGATWDMTYQQALDNKLIDGIGYLDDVINISKRASGLAETRIVTYHRHTDYRNNIYSQANINIFSLGENDILEYQPVQFMYLWNP